MNKHAQKLGKLGNKAQKKKHGKNYGKEMSRRVKVRWTKSQNPPKPLKTALRKMK